MKWSPFQAKERFKEHVAEIQTLKNSNVNKGLKLKQKTNEKIKRTILGTFSNSDSKIKEYNNGISNSLPKPSNVDDVEEEIYQKSLEFMGNFVTGLIDELETTSNMDKKNKKLEKLEKDFQTKSLEAERRKAVADTKGYGAAIEMIEILRDELKERNQLSKEITEIKKQLKGIEKFLKSHNNFKDEIEKMYMETMQSLEEKNDLESLKQRKLLKKNICRNQKF